MSAVEGCSIKRGSTVLQFVNVTSTPVGHGLATAADTLCSQVRLHQLSNNS